MKSLSGTMSFPCGFTPKISVRVSGNSQKLKQTIEELTNAILLRLINSERPNMIIEENSPRHTISHSVGSLVIPTIKERRQYLFELLQCLTNQTLKPNEIIVVCDEKVVVPRGIIAEYKKLGIKILFTTVSPELTLGVTRNIGIKKTKGNHVYFLDDDTLPTPKWLLEMTKSLEAGAEVVGGVSKPLFKKGAAVPIWWDEILIGPYVAVGNQYLKLGHGNIWGCNFAFAREVISKIGYFDEALGLRRSGPKLLAEDSEYAERAMRNGLKVRLNPRAIVYHRLNAKRINLDDLKKRAWQEGLTMKELSKKCKSSYSDLTFFKVILLKTLRGPYFVLLHKSKAIALPIHIKLLIYEIMGWLGIRLE